MKRWMHNFNQCIKDKLGDALTSPEPRNLRKPPRPWIPYDEDYEGPDLRPSREIKEDFSFPDSTVSMSEALINSEVLMYRNDDAEELERAKVICHLTDENGNIIGDYNEKVNLNTIMYEMEFLDGTRAPYAANKIDQEIYSEVDFEGR